MAKWLQDESKGTWLLVLDNLDDDTVLSTSQAPTSRVRSTENEAQLRRRLSAYLPQSQNGTILITTRTRNVALKLVEQRDIIPIDPMINTDALVLLQKKLDESMNQQDLEELASLLEYMPLAIVQAAAYIQQKGTRYSVRRYIEVFQKNDKHQMNLLKYEAGHLRRDEEAKSSIITTWQISFNDIREKWPLSADLLSLMSYFDRQGIPEAVLKVEPREEEIQDSMMQKRDSDHPDTQDEEDMSETTSDDKFDGALEYLLSYSLVSIGKDKRTFVMHGLVQLATRKWLEMQGTQERWKAQFCMKLNAVFPNGNHENWGLCEILFPHAKSAERQRPEGLLVQD